MLHNIYTGKRHDARRQTTVLSNHFLCHQAVQNRFTSQLNTVVESQNEDVCTLYLLIPMSLMADAGGPMKITPSFSHCSANSVFSDRNP